MTNIIDRLPLEISLKVFENLGPKDLHQVVQVSQSWHGIAVCLINQRRELKHAGLLEVANVIQRLAEKNILSYHIIADRLHPWLLSSVEQRWTADLSPELDSELLALENDLESPTLAKGYWFGHNGCFSLASRVRSGSECSLRKTIVLDVFRRSLLGLNLNFQKDMIYESFILGLSYLLHTGCIDKDSLVGSTPVAKEIFTISSLYSKYLLDLDSNIDSIFALTNELLEKRLIKRVMTFIQRADSGDVALEKNSTKLLNAINRICKQEELKQDPDPDAMLWRRHITVFANKNGYFFEKDCGKLYWKCGRDNRYRIECSAGYIYDEIRFLLMKGDKKLATERMKAIISERREIRDIVIPIISVGFCLESSLILADKARGHDSLFYGEITFDEYLSWLYELISLIPQEERECFIKAFLDNRSNIPSIPKEADIQVRELCDKLLEDLTYFDAIDSSCCEICAAK
jgi:hypothetical protein